MNKLLIFFLLIGSGHLNGRAESHLKQKEKTVLYGFQQSTPIPVTFKYYDYSITELPIEDLPYMDGKSELRMIYQYTKEGVPYHTFGTQTNFHSVFIAQYALKKIDILYTTGDTSIISNLKAVADKMISIAEKKNNTYCFPYIFDFPLHAMKDQMMVAPWYSGMSQGQLLSFFVRLFVITGESKYLNAARQVYNSFCRYEAEGVYPWYSTVDPKGNLWLEEYPMSPNCYTLNGMIFTIYGLYDYYLVTKNPTCKLLLQATISTIHNRIDEFRNKGDLSYYCLKHKVKDLKYHHIHARQLEVLYQITGDRKFKEVSNLLNEDGQNYIDQNMQESDKRKYDSFGH